MKYTSAALTDVGRKREHNEDAFFTDPDLGLFIVCDGVGGHAAGEVASENACKITANVIEQNAAIVRKYASEPTFANRAQAIKLIEKAIETACSEVYAMAQADSSKRGMGTTIVLLLVTGDNAIMAHVGDSRIYLYRQNEVHQLTEDHSLVMEQIKKGLLTREEAANSPYASVITRAVGFQEYVQVDTLHFELMPGDTFLLCSDGLCDYFRGGEFGEFCRKFPVDGVPKELIGMANGRGGKDNITAVVVQFEAEAGRAGIDVARKMEALKRIPLFKHLTYKELVKVLNIVTLRGYEAGDQIIKEGDMGDELFISLVGAVEVSKKGAKLAELPRGSFFGEMGLIDKAPRSADIFAKEPAKMMVIRRAEFYPLLRREPQLAVKLLWAFCQVLNERLRATSATAADAKAAMAAADSAQKMLFGEDEAN